MRIVVVAILSLALSLTGGCGKGTTSNENGGNSGFPNSGLTVPPKSGESGNIEPPLPEEPANVVDPSRPGKPTTAESIAEELKRMTLDEKLGAMMIAGLDGTEGSAQTKALIQKHHVGGFIFYKENITTPEGVAAYVNQLKAWNKGSRRPLLISVDQEGGRVSRLPGLHKVPAARVIGDTGDVSYASAIGTALGKASKVMGFNVDFAPVLDINSNPNNPVIGDRSFGASSKRVTDMGIAVMKSIQHEGVIPVVKHFPGHGDTSVDSHLELPIVNKSLQQLKAFEWTPFKAAVNTGADMVMVAHILFAKLDQNYPASLSKTIITDHLRKELGYAGVVITDDMGMGAISKHFGMVEACLLTVKAGSDIILLAHGYEDVTIVLTALKEAVKKGDISEKRIDESVSRILSLKWRYKLSDAAISSHPDVNSVNVIIKKAVAGH